MNVFLKKDDGKLFLPFLITKTKIDHFRFKTKPSCFLNQTSLLRLGKITRDNRQNGPMKFFIVNHLKKQNVRGRIIIPLKSVYVSTSLTTLGTVWTEGGSS